LNMPDFILKEREFDRVPDFLATAVPSFVESEQYRLLDPEDQKVPGLVCAAFTRYFEQLQQAEINAGDKSDALERCYAFIEDLALSPDPAVKNLVVTEIFENLQGPNQTLKKMKERLGTESRRLYQSWVDPSA